MTQDILKSKTGNSIPFWLQPSISWDHDVWDTGQPFTRNELLLSSLLSLRYVDRWCYLLHLTFIQYFSSGLSLTTWHIPVSGGVVFSSQPSPSFVSSLHVRIWILFQVTLLCGLQIQCCSGKYYEMHLQLERVEIGPRWVWWDAWRFQLVFLPSLGCHIPSRTNLKSQISVWKHSRYLPLCPRSKANHDKKMHRFSSNHLLWMKIKNSFKETIPVKVSLHQDNPISSCWDLPALCLLYGLVLQTGKNKTKQKNPCPYTELYCISMEIVLFLFFGCSKRTKAFIQLWVLWVKYDPPAPPSGYILELKKSLR